MIKSLERIKGKKIAIVGLGKTGIALSKFLHQQGAQVVISDHKSEAELSDCLEEVKDFPFKLELEGHNPKTFIQQDCVILSPGVPSHLKLFEYVRSRGIEVTGEFEFASRFITEPIVTITGTNGKTTVLNLSRAFLEKSGVNVWTGGNYGQPLSQYLLENKKADVLLTEASSFMLEHTKCLKPKTIVFTNLAEDHLDRYPSLEDYVNAKSRVFTNANPQVTSILNADNDLVIKLANEPIVQRGRIFYFSTREILKPQIMNIGGAIMIDREIHVRTRPEKDFFHLKNTHLKGLHSCENILAAILVAKEHGGVWQHIQRGIDEYKGMKHRMEYVRKVGGVTFYNDSKATNVHAVQKALETFRENVILIMGGKWTGLNYKPLGNLIRRKVKNLILFGEAKEAINRDIGNFTETFLVGTFEEAIFISYHKSRIGDRVLLSPGCSSFDIFNSYKERGNLFKEIVNKFS